MATGGLLKYIKTDVITIPDIICTLLSEQIMSCDETICLQISFHKLEAVYILILDAALYARAEHSFLLWRNLSERKVLSAHICIFVYQWF